MERKGFIGLLFGGMIGKIIGIIIAIVVIYFVTNTIPILCTITGGNMPFDCWWTQFLGLVLVAVILIYKA